MGSAVVAFGGHLQDVCSLEGSAKIRIWATYWLHLRQGGFWNWWRPALSDGKWVPRRTSQEALDIPRGESEAKRAAGGHANSGYKLAFIPTPWGSGGWMGKDCHNEGIVPRPRLRSSPWSRRLLIAFCWRLSGDAFGGRWKGVQQTGQY
jgi:hypothetical protein